MLGSAVERKMDPWGWWRIRRHHKKRVSWAIIFLCLIQVVAWTHPVGVAAANDSAGAEAMQLLRDQYESTVGNLKSGVGDSMNARQHLEGKAFEEAGLNRPPPLPPDPPQTTQNHQATSGHRLNSKRSAASSASSVHPSTGPDARRRLAAVDGWQKKNAKRGAGEAGALFDGAVTVLLVGVFVGAVAGFGRSAATLLGRRGGLPAVAPRLPLSGVVRAPLRASVPLVSGAPHQLYGSTSHHQAPSAVGTAIPACPHAATTSVEVRVHETTTWDWLSRPSEIVAALNYKMGGGFAGGGNVASLLDDSEDARFCDDMLQKTSRSFAAVIQQLPPELRPGVCVFYLLLRALDTIEDDMTVDLQPKLSLLRTFYEQVQDPSLVVRGYGFEDERVLLEQLPRLLRVFKALPQYQQDVITDITRRMGVGMADFGDSDLRDGVATIDDYNLYCHYVAGLVGEGLTRLFASSELEQTSLQSATGLALSNDMGLMLQKTNIIRDFLEDFVDGRTWWPKEIFGHYVPELAALADPENSQKATACLNHMVTDALELLPSCAAYLDRLQHDAVVRFCLIPQLMAMGTQAACYNNPDVFTGIVKMRPGLAAKLILSTQQRSAAEQRAVAKEWFVTFARQIESKIDGADPSAERTRQAVRAVEECCGYRVNGGPKQQPDAIQQV